MFGVWGWGFGIKFLCVTSFTHFSAVKKMPTPMKEQAFKLFGVYCLVLKPPSPTLPPKGERSIFSLSIELIQHI
jgi:hypothetical protein